MAVYENLEVVTYEAAADVSANQFHAVVPSGGQVALAGAAAQDVVGILQDNLGTAAGQAVQVGYSGKSKAKAGAAFAVDALLTTDATGRLVTAALGEHVHAIALQAAGAADEIVTVRLGYLGTAP